MSQFLILKPSSLGDVLHAFPAVSALLRAYPGSVADWLIAPQFADLTAFLPGVALDSAERYVSAMRSVMGNYKNAARSLSVSFGCSVMKGPEDFDACLRVSDEAMYRDKRRRKKDRN